MRPTTKDNPNKGLSFLYNTKLGRSCLKFFVNNNFISNLVGKFMDSKLSCMFINKFIKNNNINLNEFVSKKYISFNDFFTRKVKQELRPINIDSNELIAPADSKLTCYKITKDLLFNIKNSTYNLSSIINDDIYSKVFKDGDLLVFRLSPEDYHHYCYPCDGIVIKKYKINGKFHSVNPIVYDNFKVFKENTREITIIDTKKYGVMIYIEVGALLVGKIKNNNNNINIKKGEEKGYFEYGGSTVIMIFQKDKLIIDKDLVKNSEKKLETCVKYGEKIAKSKK